jgi:glyoxylase-like metal-dependent hydrolase (beta-lactamase superfamily II)
VARFPEVPVYVHEVGAPHLIDPEKLLRSAGRLYGGEMEALWGEVLPVPAANVTTLSGGEEVDGLRVLYTPGHASHHVTYLDEESGDAYVGDVGGVLIPPAADVWAPTPPPDIDVELWEASIDEVASNRPERLLLTHFGAADDPVEHLDAMRRELRRLAEHARSGDRATFLAALEERIERAPAEVAVRTRQAMPPDQVWQGLERYWAKREAA